MKFTDIFEPDGFRLNAQFVIWVAQIIISAFFAILFLQSGMDKVMDRKGNLEWLTAHFAKSPLRNLVPLLLFKITFTEILSGLLCAAGVVAITGWGNQTLSVIGLLLCLLNFTMLFFGQRLAKDYAGAATLAAYFGAALVGLLILMQR